MRSYEQTPITKNSRTTQELSDNIKISQNGQDLTTWLVDKRVHNPTVQDFSNFDDVYLWPQGCGEVRLLEILIVLIYSINWQNLGYLQHQ